MRLLYSHRTVGMLPAMVLALGLSSWAGPSIAQVASSDRPATLSLSDTQKAEILSHNTEADVDGARAGLGNGPASRQIHGEVGAMIGSNGTRGAYGTAAVPLGDHAGAIVSFESSRYGGPH